MPSAVALPLPLGVVATEGERGAVASVVVRGGNAHPPGIHETLQEAPGAGMALGAFFVFSDV